MPDRSGHVLGHPLRHWLLFQYLSGPVSPSDLARRRGEPVNRVAYHTGVLVRAGYVTLVGTKRRRGAVTHLYRATIAPEIDGTDWEALPVAMRRELTLGVLGTAMDAARSAARDGGFDGADTHLTRTPLRLDEEGIAAVAALLRESFQALGAIIANVATADDAQVEPYEIVMLAYQRPDGTL